jgi:hypothetical protein
MITTTTFTAPVPIRGRRSRRLCIDAHTDFVATLVTELKSSVARLRAAAGRPEDIGRETSDIARLVGLLDAIDGPGDSRHLAPISLPGAVLTAAGRLGLSVAVTGQAGPELFVADRACVGTALELLLLALAGEGGSVEVGIAGDRAVTVAGTMDLSDERRSWQLRSGRRVLEGEGLRLRLTGGGSRYSVELTAGR